VQQNSLALIVLTQWCVRFAFGKPRENREKFERERAAGEIAGQKQSVVAAAAGGGANQYGAGGGVKVADAPTRFHSTPVCST